ncbi:MAG: hypothetical protein JNK02_15495 [Planctomycetes bacterium]|nr:hypothetical protein [Planctomycetota bacterium]
MLLHELSNHTQYLAALGALTAAGGDLPDGGEGLAHVGREVEELGWLLGLCAAGLGTDLVFERTEDAGLAPLVKLVQMALRRAGRELPEPARPLPALPPSLGWRGALACGAALLAAARAADGPLAWSLEAVGDELVLECAVPLGAFGPEPWAGAQPGSRGPGWTCLRITPASAR